MVIKKSDGTKTHKNWKKMVGTYLEKKWKKNGGQKNGGKKTHKY